MVCFRSFIDFSNNSLSNDFGKETEEYNKWEELQSHYYDNYFEYRFLCKLRNFTQHVGFPPLKIGYTSSIDQNGIVLSIDFQKESLLEHKNIWKSKIYTELIERNEDIKFIPLLEVFDGIIKELYSKLFKIKLPRAIKSSKAILTYRNKLKIEESILYTMEISLRRIKEPKLVFQCFQKIKQSQF